MERPGEPVDFFNRIHVLQAFLQDVLEFFVLLPVDFHHFVLDDFCQVSLGDVLDRQEEVGTYERDYFWPDGSVIEIRVQVPDRRNERRSERRVYFPVVEPVLVGIVHEEGESVLLAQGNYFIGQRLDELAVIGLDRFGQRVLVLLVGS